MSEPRITIDSDQFVRIDGVCIGRVYAGSYIEFVDKNKYRSNERGTRYVRVPILTFVAHLLSFIPEKEIA